MDDNLILLLFYAVVIVAIGVGSLITLVLTLIPVAIIIFNIAIASEILTYEWDGAERLLWLAVAFFLFPIGVVIYIALRRPQRNSQLAILRKAQDPRIAHIPPTPNP